MTQASREIDFSAVRGQVILFTAARLVINASYRMIYPFLVVLAGGMGVSLATASLALTGRSLVGMLGPLFAPAADRYGRKMGMLLGLGLFCVGAALAPIWPGFPAFFSSLLLMNLSNQIFLPATQAYLGDRVPYRRRGAVLAVTEMSWSLSFILLVPLAGLLISRFGWSAPFYLWAALGLLAFLVLAWRIPAADGRAQTAPGSLFSGLKQVIANPLARTALLVGLSITTANEVVNLVFGVWMYESFQLEIAALGLAASVVGAAELSGEAASAWLADRVGKKRAVRAGIILTSLAAVALPIFGQSLWGALAGLFFFYLGFEFTLVSSIPLMTEVMPSARATLMAANLASFSLGRALGALSGAWLFSLGIGANALVAIALNGVAFLALARLKIADE